MSDGGSRFLTIAVAAAFALAVLAALAIVIDGPGIEGDIGARATAALAPYPGVTATANGRTVTLSGTVADDATAGAAAGAVDGLPGVHAVESELKTGAGSIAVYRFSAAWDGRTMTLSGYMPTRDAREETVTHARDMLKAAEIVDRMEVSAGAPDGNWQPIAAACIAAMRTLAQATLEMKGTAINFTGTARSAADAEKAKEILGSLPTPYTVSPEIAVDANAGPAGSAPYRFSAAYDGAGIALAGAVPSADVATAFAAALKTALPKAVIDSHVAPTGGAPDGAWADAALIALKAFANTRAATLTFADRAIMLQATAADAASRGRIVAAFGDLPAAYSATLSISVDKEAAPLEQTVGSPDGDAAKCQSAFAAAIAEAPIAFASASAKLPDAAAPLIEKLGTIAGTCPKARIEIAGHTDASGKAESNQKLSQDRAEAVEAALILKGVDAKRVSAHGYGAARPIAANNNDADKAKNRRIEVIVRP